MAALHLHHAFFTNEKNSDLPLRSATPFLRPAPERDGSPAYHLFASTAYQDLIQRQPTHPDGPTSGWDLGLNLLGDPITTAEQKNEEGYQTKMKLRRLNAVNTTFELLFGIWGTYTTIRYFLAVADGLDGPGRICSLVLGVMSALALGLVITSVLMPLLPQQGHPRTWRSVRSLFRAGYLFLLYASAMMNLILVLIWHPDRLCNWDLDISWYTPAASAATTPCHAVPFAAWIAAAALRLVVTSILALSFVYTLRSFYGTRHPTSEANSPKYSYFPSDPDYVSPVSTSSPFDHLSKSMFKPTRSEDSSHTLSNHSTVTLLKSNSMSTLAPSTSCTGHSRSHSHSTTFSKQQHRDISPPRISPPTSRRTSTSTSATKSSHTQCGTETPSSLTQPVNVVITASSASQMLRRTSRISVTQLASDTVPSEMSSCLERNTGLTSPCDSSEIRSCAPWRPSGHRGTVTHLDGKKTMSQETAHGVGPLSTCDDGESSKEKEKHPDDSDLVYSYGYGVSGPTYPYLDIYNPQEQSGYPCTLSSSSASLSREAVDRRGGFSHGHSPRHTTPSGPVFPDDPRSSHSRPEGDLDEYMYEGSSSGEEEEEEYVAMMGGFVRRMATIESLGSREAVSMLSGPMGSVALGHSVRSGSSRTPSSVRFADLGCRSSLGTASMGMTTMSREGSPSTAYFSFSSGGTSGAGVWVNERGELLPGPRRDRGGTAGSSCDRYYYTAASKGSLPKIDDEDE